MKSVRIRGSVVAAIASIFVLGCGVTTPVHAQQSALAANPELAARGVWSASTAYIKDDIVTARGSTWIAKRNNVNRVPGQTTQPSTAADWQLFARGFNPTGAWSNAVTYQPDDLVTFNGQTFRAKLTKSNRQPAANQFWELFAAKGDPGPNTGVSNGSSSAPSISFTGDPDTGIFSPAPGKIAMVENGVLFLHNMGTLNTALGTGALSANTSGNSNTAVGQSALAANTNGGGNTAVGASALANNTGHFNTALGTLALNANTTGDYNTAVGPSAMFSNTTGYYNTAVGIGALTSNTTGHDNIAMGISALGVNALGNSNVVIGNSALANLTTGSANVAIGDLAGGVATNPSNSIFIGNQGASGDSNTIRIGTQGTQATAFMAGVRGQTTGVADAVAVLVDSNGQLGTVSSSRRYKTDIETMADVSAMLGKLRPVTFRYRQAQNEGEHPLQYGLIAEEVADVFPDLAVFNKDGSAETVKYHLLPSFLLAGYQAQQNTIAAQSEEIALLKERVTANDALEERLRRLEALLPQSKAASLR